ncbi:MAG: hypothetical protein WBA41_08460 [Rivularia sp. (in: cyanobacteria)]
MNKPEKPNKNDNLQPLQPLRGKALSSSTLSVRVDLDIYIAVCNLEDRTGWLRSVIENEAVKQGLVNNSNILEEAITKDNSTSKDYEAIKLKIINEWGKQGRMKQSEVAALAIDKFIKELNK